MPRRKWIDKKAATTFQLLHRAQNDPLIHDENASQMVFAEAPVPNQKQQSNNPYGAYPSSSGASFVSSASRRNASRGDLEAEFGYNVRANEGEAAEYGVYYDDSKYDYMQHMRDLGQGGGESVWVEAPSAKKKNGGGKGKQKLEDALRELEVSDSASQAGSLASGLSTASHVARDVFDSSMLPSDFVRKTSYQDQQDVPDAIRGFQPDMDPRLREVLEALEDEAYVDEGEDGDFFEALTGDGAEVDLYDFEASGWSDEGPPSLEDDDGWETDDTIKPDKPSKKKSGSPQTPSSPTIPGDPLTTNPDDLPAPEEAPADRIDTSWQAEFAKFKEAVKSAPGARAAPREPRASNIAADLQSESILTGASSLLSTGRRKKRKGALTNSSSFSMSSSTIPRTEAMSFVDERFEKLEKIYAEDYPEDYDDENDGVSLVSGMTGMSRMTGLSRMSGMSIGDNAPRSDFNSLVDDFLGTHSTSGKRRVKRGKQQTGMEQLDEIRQGLGPVKVGKSAAKT